MTPLSAADPGQPRVALVIGGTRGIGKAIALRLARDGANVMVNYFHNEESAAATVAELRGCGVQAESLRCDVGDREAVVAMVKSVGERFGHIDVLVLSAAQGMERPHSALNAFTKHLHHTMDVNVFGPWFASQAAAPYMPKGAAIVNLLSPGSRRYVPRYAAVGVSKGALESLTVYLAVELAPRGIRVNGVSPGLVEGTDDVRMIDPKSLAEYAGKIPCRRHVQPDDIADAVAFLASPAASMIVGQVLHVDGGYSLLAL